MQRAVVVAAVGGQHGQAVGVMPGAHQVVAGGLAGRVRAVGLVEVVFGEGRCRRRQAAVDLVGGDMQEAEGRLGLGIQRAPVAAHGFEQAEGADHVGLDEVLGAMDGAVHMALGREVDHGARPVLGQQAGQDFAIADVGLHEDMARIALQALQALEVARVGELVHVEHRLIAGSQPVQHEIGADEAGAACDKNHGSTLQNFIVLGSGFRQQPAVLPPARPGHCRRSPVKKPAGGGLFPSGHAFYTPGRIHWPCQRRSTSEAFVPPKPKLLDSTVFNWASRVRVTRGMSPSAGSGVSTLTEPAMKPLFIMIMQ